MPRLIPRRLAPDEQATLVEHLSELRHRLVICLVAIVPAFIFTFAIHGWLIGKLQDLAPPDTQFVTLGVTEPLTTSFKVAGFAAVAICLPVIVWQIWAFFAPALDRRTQRALSAFVIFATALFASGIAFGYFVLLPRALGFLVDYDSDLYDVQIRASYFLSFVTLTLFATGIAFMMPIFILGLVRIGVLSSAKLRKNRRIGIVVMVCFAILLPTVDPVSLIFETVPLIILYELSIWLAVWMERRWEPLIGRWDVDEEDYDISDHAPLDPDEAWTPDDEPEDVALTDDETDEDGDLLAGDHEDFEFDDEEFAREQDLDADDESDDEPDDEPGRA